MRKTLFALALPLMLLAGCSANAATVQVRTAGAAHPAIHQAHDEIIAAREGRMTGCVEEHETRREAEACIRDVESDFEPVLGGYEIARLAYEAWVDAAERAVRDGEGVSGADVAAVAFATEWANLLRAMSALGINMGGRP
jgi:hypothetical protein